MGFGDFIQPPLPISFTDPNTGAVDWSAFDEDIRGKLITDHLGFINGISTAALARYYFRRTDVEACLVMEAHLQSCRAALMDRGIILRNAYRRWHIVDNAAEALGFIVNRTRRVVRAYGRTTAVSEIATLQYPELAMNPVLKALGSAERSIKRLKKASDDKQLPKQ